MAFRPRSTVYEVDDPSWRVSRDGKGTERTITLDLSQFDEATHYPNGFVPSGTAVSKVGEEGLYGPYFASPDGGTTPGSGPLEGFVAEPVYDVPTRVASGENALAALMWRGVVAGGLLPIDVDQGARDAVAGRIRFE